MRQRDHHRFVVNQIFEVQVLLVGQNRGATGIAVLGTQLSNSARITAVSRSGTDRISNHLNTGQQFVVFIQQFALLQTGQSVQP